MSASSRRSRLSFPIPLAALGAAILLAFSGPAATATVPPEKQHGTIGHYAILDAIGQPLVRCHYSGVSSHKLDRFVARPPGAWWPDTSSASDTQHGTIGWQLLVQSSGQASGGSWTTVYASSIQKKTAHEDPPPNGYDESRAAPFTKRTLAWSRSGGKYYRIIDRLIWYNPDGTPLGSLKHWIDAYRLTGSYEGSGTGSCSNLII